MFGWFYNAHHFPIEIPGQERTQGGFGGYGLALRTRIGRLSFGSMALDRPLTSLNFAPTGLFSRSYTGGNLGYGVLRNFIFTLDYEHNLAYFKRSAVFGQPETYIGSGMTLKRARDGAVAVERVNPNTPRQRRECRATIKSSL